MLDKTTIISTSILAIILWIFGLGIICYFSGWQVAIGVLICFWASNIESNVKHARKNDLSEIRKIIDLTLKELK